MMFRAMALRPGDRFIPADDVSQYGNNEHLIFYGWIKRGAIGYFHGHPELGMISLHVEPGTDVLLARPVHHEEPTYSI